MAEERLQKYLASAGVASRRASEKLILEGKVAVNGKVVKELGTKVIPGKDKVTVDGKPVRTEEQLVYYLMNKPAGYLTTVKDTHDRPTVMDLLAGIPYRVFPVGRLDFETEGLLLLTNDGEFAYRMTHPKFKIKKTYLATVQGELTKERLQMLREGVELEDGKTAPAEVKVVRQEKHRTVVEITIHEGKNRQVRRMFKAVKNPVLELKRINVGGLTLKGVGSGEIRSLTDEELQKLTQRLGMHRGKNSQSK
ncbi:MAG: rRNA pseudouridine synthase [Peptococcaceae bacterium]|nr:rRNA pseudouridine synthase [Peptococcaceae bacterium]MBP3341865.1 rRNA pseudouridine synthase [Peptococcaceae bacterium]